MARSDSVLSSLLVKISADGSTAQAEFKKLEQDVGKLAKKMKRIGTNMSTYITAPLVAAGALAVTTANTQMQAEARLLTALKGRKEVQDRLIAQAAQLQSKSIYGDETIIEQQAFLAALGLTERQIGATINAAVQLSAALGMDLNSATRNLAKTYSGLAGELGESIPALRNLTAEQMKAGGAIEYVNANYKGFAETAAQTGMGPLQQLKNSLGDLAEQFGMVLVPIIQKLADKLKEIAERFQQLSPRAREGITTIAAVAAAFGPLLVVGGKLLTSLKLIIAIIPKLGTALSTLIANPVGAAITAVGLLAATWLRARDNMREYERQVMQTAREQGKIDGKQQVNDAISSAKSVYEPFDTEALERKRASLVEEIGRKKGRGESSYKENTELLAIIELLKERKVAQDGVNDSTKASIGLIPQLEAKIKTLNEALNRATDKTTIAKINADLEKTRQELEELRNLKPVEQKVVVKYEVITVGGDGSKGSSTSGNVGIKGVSAPKMGDLIGNFRISDEEAQAMLDEANKIAKLNEQVTSIIRNSVTETATLLGEGLGALFSGTKFDWANKLMELLGTTLKQLGQALVQYGTAMEAFKVALKETFKNPWITIAAGIAAIAAGAILVATAKKPVKLATGGLAYGPTLAVVGDNPGASSDPEVVAPLSKLSKYLGGGQKLELSGNIEWVLEGDSLRAVLNRENVRLARMGR
ncbi:MAG: hypothetical protein II322_02910 [Alistipes sp.]|nr:hypothetical protein [Alistipes sp.]